MTERDQVVNQLVFAASALRSLDLGVIGDLLGRAYDAGAAAERAAKPEVWVVTRDYETSAGGDDSEDVGLFWSQAGAEKFREEYLVAHEYERPDRVSVYRAQVKP